MTVKPPHADTHPKKPAASSEPFQVKRILVPIDFSACSDRAFQVARDLAKTHGASLLVQHVYQIPMYTLPEGVVFAGPELEATFSDVAQTHLDQWASKQADSGTSFKTVLSHGAPAQEITHLAEKENIDVIVIGTNGRTGISRLLLGSVAERVTRSSPVPVLTVPPLD